MNKQPKYYMQTDARWKNKPYRVTGEDTTIGDSGCGPTCAAMLIETLTGKTFTPVDACNWAMKKGYKALKQGTYYSYFVPQFAAHGIKCERLNTANLYGKGTNSLHDKVFQMLKEGYYIIACMGKGTWTSSGHFVVVWWEDGKVRINDPYSKNNKRINGDLKTFKSQVKYYFAIDARTHNAVSETKKETATTKPSQKITVAKAKSKDATVKKGKVLTVTASALNVRADGKIDASNILYTIPRGTKVTWYGYYTNDFYYVQLPAKFGGGTGYVSKKYVK